MIAERKGKAMPLLQSSLSEKIRMLQLLDDAIAYRQGRLNLPCQECRTDGRCAEHCQDLELVASYQDRHAAAFSDALAGMDPADVALIMPPGHDVPSTVGAASLAALTWLRELAANGPVSIELGGRPVEIEVEGTAIVEYLLPPDSER